MNIDGKAIAAEILAKTRERVLKLGRPVRLTAISADSSPATASYLRIKTEQAAKAGVQMRVDTLAVHTSTLGIVAAITQAAQACDALIVQLPLPPGVDQKAVLDAIPMDEDADLLSAAARAPFNHGGFVHPEPLMPPVVGAIKEIFERMDIVAKGKRAAVIGNGWLVGAPVAIWLEQQGADVALLTKGTARFSETVLNADIVVAGAGAPGIVTRDILKRGAVVIDAGTSESGGAIVGDVDPAAAHVAGIFTPVPGGLGPIAVAKLFENAVTLAERASSKALGAS